jgi:hypothetical protein
VEKVECWPPPDWIKVVITWDEVFAGMSYPLKEILDGINKMPGGRYHLHGYKSTEGFEFRFEDPEDAVYFKLRWV